MTGSYIIICTINVKLALKPTSVKIQSHLLINNQYVFETYLKTNGANINLIFMLIILSLIISILLASIDR